MRDNELILEILHQIEKSAQKVVQRFQAISKPKDFTDTPAGVEKMDAICMIMQEKNTRSSWHNSKNSQ